MVVDTRHKWDVLISYSWMDVIPTHNGRFYLRPSTMIKMSRFLLSSFVPNGFSLHCVLSFHRETNDAEREEKGRHTSQKLD